MRIIGGSHKGRLILPPSGFNARPTTDFAKEGLFNVIEHWYNYDECRVLDLFAGTGSISFEFASRGCRNIISVEMNPLHYSFIKKSALTFGFSGIRVVRQNVFDFIKICNEFYDVIFADPPYDIKGLETIPDKIFPPEKEGSRVFLKESGVFILEHPGTYSFVNHPHFAKEKKYGNVHFSFFV